MIKHVRISLIGTIGSGDVTAVKRVRIDSYGSIGTVTAVKHIRINSTAYVSPHAIKRVRIESTFEMDYPEVDPWNINYETFRDEIITDGIGSILNGDLSLKNITNDNLYLKSGYFYSDYVEYFAYGDDYRNIPLVSGVADTGNNYYSYTVSKSGIIGNNCTPITIVSDSATSQFVTTYNPSNSGGYRKIYDLSTFTESIDGETQYTFTRDSGTFEIIDSGSYYEIRFHIDDTGDKYLVTSNNDINLTLPNTNINKDTSGFLIISERPILVTPDSVEVFIAKKQFTTNDVIPIAVKVSGRNGEFARGYPILINDSGTTTDDYGYVETVVPVSSYIVVETDTGTALPSIYDTGSYNFKYLYKI